MRDQDDSEDLRRALVAAEHARYSDSLRIEMLEREVREVRSLSQHRIRNILAVVRSVARRSASGALSVDDYQSRIDGRIGAIARIHMALVRTSGGGLDLGLIIDEELLACGIRPGAQAHVEGVSVHLTPPAAEVMGLAFHELAINALEHGTLLDGDCDIDVRWRRDVKNRDLRIDWVEKGCPSRDASELQWGFGADVLRRAIAYQLGGTALIDLTGTGLHCRIRLPGNCLST